MSIHKKKKVTKTVITLVFTFIILWFPVHFLATWYRIDENFPEGNVMFVLKLIAHTMSYSISTINPIIYAGFFNRQLRVPMRLASSFSRAIYRSNVSHTVHHTNTTQTNTRCKDSSCVKTATTLKSCCVTEL